MSKKPIYPSEFKLEAAGLVLDQGYSIAKACKEMNVGRTAMTRWVNQLRAERAGETPQAATAMTEQQREIQKLKATIKRLEREKEILKKASALLMTDTFSV